MSWPAESEVFHLHYSAVGKLLMVLYCSSHDAPWQILVLQMYHTFDFYSIQMKLFSCEQSVQPYSWLFLHERTTLHNKSASTSLDLIEVNTLQQNDDTKYPLNHITAHNFSNKYTCSSYGYIPSSVVNHLVHAARWTVPEAACARGVKVTGICDSLRNVQRIHQGSVLIWLDLHVELYVHRSWV